MPSRFARHAVALALLTAGLSQPALAFIPGWPEEEKAKPAEPVTTEQEAGKKAEQARQHAMQHEINAAWAATQDVAVHGPETATLASGITMNVPSGFIYIPQPYAERILKASMIPSVPDLAGFIVNTGQGWTTLVSVSNLGHVATDGGVGSPESTLAGVIEQNRQSDRERVAQGKSATTVYGWNQPPTFDPATQSLTWSLHARFADEVETGTSTARYQAVIFGRTRQVNLTSLVPQSYIAAQAPVVKNLISSVRFGPGQGYADYDSDKDPKATTTMMALYGGTDVFERESSFPATPLLLGLAALMVGGGFVVYRRKRQIAEEEVEA